MSDPDLSITPIAYTIHEGERYQLWDNPTKYNAILWADGRRWDTHNQQIEQCLTLEQVADVLQSLTGGDWVCETHRRVTTSVFRGVRTCPPDCDVDHKTCVCRKL